MPFKDPEMKRAYNRERFRRLYAQDPAAFVASTLRTRDPAKHRARATLNYAKRTGKIQQQPCEMCANPKSEAHHEDYSRPLDVRWLCRLHHAAAHSRAVAA